MSRIDIESTERMIKSLTIFNMTQEEMTNALKKVYDSIAADCRDGRDVLFIDASKKFIKGKKQNDHRNSG